MSQINPIPNNDTYLFKVHSNILPSTPRPYQRSLSCKFIFKILKAPYLPSSGYMTSPSQSSRFKHPAILVERYKLSSSLGSLLHSPFSSLLDSNFRLRNLFSNTLSLHSVFIVRGHVSHPYSKTGNIIVL